MKLSIEIMKQINYFAFGDIKKDNRKVGEFYRFDNKETFEAIRNKYKNNPKVILGTSSLNCAPEICSYIVKILK